MYIFWTPDAMMPMVVIGTKPFFVFSSSQMSCTSHTAPFALLEEMTLKSFTMKRNNKLASADKQLIKKRREVPRYCVITAAHAN